MVCIDDMPIGKVQRLFQVGITASRAASGAVQAARNPSNAIWIDESDLLERFEQLAEALDALDSAMPDGDPSWPSYIRLSIRDIRNAFHEIIHTWAWIPILEVSEVRSAWKRDCLRQWELKIERAYIESVIALQDAVDRRRDLSLELHELADLGRSRGLVAASTDDPQRNYFEKLKEYLITTRFGSDFSRPDSDAEWLITLSTESRLIDNYASKRREELESHLFHPRLVVPFISHSSKPAPTNSPQLSNGGGAGCTIPSMVNAPRRDQLENKNQSKKSNEDRIRLYLSENPEATSEKVAKATNTPAATVRNSKPWKALRQSIKITPEKMPRERSLTRSILATKPGTDSDPSVVAEDYDELEQLFRHHASIDEQKAFRRLKSEEKYGHLFIWASDRQGEL